MQLHALVILEIDASRFVVLLNVSLVSLHSLLLSIHDHSTTWPWGVGRLSVGRSCFDASRLHMREAASGFLPQLAGTKYKESSNIMIIQETKNVQKEDAKYKRDGREYKRFTSTPDT